MGARRGYASTMAWLHKGGSTWGAGGREEGGLEPESPLSPPQVTSNLAGKLTPHLDLSMAESYSYLLSNSNVPPRGYLNLQTPARDTRGLSCGKVVG